MSLKPSPFNSNLKRVRGLGTAHEGVHHFILIRTTALALIPLSIWFLYQLITVLMEADRDVAAEWFRDPISALLLSIFMVAMIIHSRLGIQTIIEDYVHCECAKIGLLLFNSGIKLLLCLASIVAIAHLHFNGI